MKRTDEQALHNMIHTCNSFDFENRPLDDKNKELWYSNLEAGTHTLYAEET